MNFDNISIEQFNEHFMSIVEDPSMIKQASEAGSQFIRQKLREDGVMRRYFGDAFERVTTEDPRYQIDPGASDTGYLLVDKEPDSYALMMTFRGQPQAEYITGSKFIIPFLKFQAPVFEKNEMELKNIRMPITQVIQTNLLYDMQEQEDLYFKTILDRSIEVTGNLVTSAETLLGKSDLRKLINTVETKRLRTEAFIMSTTTLNDALEWQHNDIGDTVSTVVRDGVPYDTLFGKRLITTTNTDVIKYGEIYSLVAPNFLGVAAALGDPTFWVQKKMDLLRMASWYYAGFNVGNIRGIARLELASFDSGVEDEENGEDVGNGQEG